MHDNLFPDDRSMKLDRNYLIKMGLNHDRMVECDALFFYQLLVAIVDQHYSGIRKDPRMGYYEGVAENTNHYANGVKRRSGMHGHKFGQTNLGQYSLQESK